MALTDINIGSKIHLYLLDADQVAITSATQALTSATDLGELTTDGFAFARNPVTETISSNNSGVVRTIYTDSEVTLGATAMEDTETVRYFVTGVESVGGVITDDGKSSWRGGVVADIIDDQLEGGLFKVKRIWIPSAQVTSTDEVTMNGTAGIQYGFVLTAYKNSLIDGGKYRQFDAIIDPAEPVIP